MALIFRFGGFYADIRRAIADIRILKNNVRAIANSLAKSPNIEFDHSLLKEYSPLQLTEKGEEFLEAKAFDHIFRDNKDVFFASISADKPSSKYDVETSAYKTIFALLEQPFFNPVKKFYYEHPNESIQSFAKVGSIFLRDRYLESHPEITE
ncbi:MAG: hypothetical protein IPL87_05055 [Candidatus Moraniibacteriota bacterium]|nr:MAG: hypothetical protein IPL87_05055 [Candidatus Moranbacteria bacterium]